MKVFLDGKRVGKRKANGWVACYLNNKAYFTKKGLTKRTVLHELYHHLMDARGLEVSTREEEKEANSYARVLIEKRKTRV